MANTNAPFGFRPIKHLNGNPWNGKFNIYYVPATDGTAIYKGDAVTMSGTGSADGLYPGVQQAAATDATMAGVAIGFGTTPNLMADPTNLARMYRPASTAMYVAVVDDPTVIFEAQEDSDGGSIAVTAIGNNADLVVGTGSTTTGTSGMTIDSSGVGTGSAQIRIMRLVNRPDNELGDYAKWEVMINESVYKTTTGS